MKIIITFLIWFWLLPIGSSQNWSHIYKSVTVLDVVELQNDLWVGTDVGLFQVDKASLAVIHHTRDNSPLPDNHIQTLAKDQFGNLWIGTYAIALIKINSGNGTWNIFNYPSAINGTQLGTNEIYSIDIGPNGKIWLGSKKGLMSFDGSTWDYTNISSNTPIWDLAINSQGKISMASFNLLEYDIITDTWTEQFHPALPASILSYSNGRVVQRNDTTVFFFPGHTSSIGSVFSFHNGNWTTWNSSTGIGNGLSDLPLDPHPNTHLILAPNNDVYFNTSSDVLVYHDGSQWRVDSSISQQSTGINTIDNTFISSNGDLWSFSKNSMLKHNSSSTLSTTILPLVNFYHSSGFFTDNNREFYLTDFLDGIKKYDQGTWTTIPGAVNYPNYTRTCFDINNDVWFISQDFSTNTPRIIQQDDPVAGTWTIHDSASSGGMLPSISGTSFYDMEISTNNIVLVRDNLNALYKHTSNTWSLVMAAPSTPSNVVASPMTADGLGNIWWIERLKISSQNYSYSLKKFDGSSILSYAVNGAGFIKPYIDSNNHIWTSLGIGQLNKYDGSSWTTYNFASSSLTTAITGQNNTIFLSTSDDGIYEYSSLAWSNYTKANSPLTDNSIGKLALDADGRLWVGNSLGKVIDIYDSGLVISSSSDIKTIEKPTLIVYPNPSRDIIHLETTIDEIESIQVLNSMGQSVLQLNNKKLKNIDVSELPSGIYWISISAQKKQYNQPFVKK